MNVSPKVVDSTIGFYEIKSEIPWSVLGSQSQPYQWM